MKRDTGLILRHNLYGVDIDPRATQIAALALWLRAQRSYRTHQVSSAERPPIRRTNTVVAEPMPGEADLREEFLGSLDSKLATVMRRVFEVMEIAADAGPLLRIERDIKTIIREVYGVTGTLFEAVDRDAWSNADRRLLNALRDYGTATAATPVGARKRLFADNAIGALEFIDICRRKFDVVLMNPPFGEFIDQRFDFMDREYTRSKRDIAVAFLERGLELAPVVGGLHSRKPFFLDTQSAWREGLRERAHFAPVADLGHRVLDNALVEVAASVIRLGRGASTFIQCLDASDKRAALREALRAGGGQHSRSSVWDLNEFACLPSGQFAYIVPRALLSVYERCGRLDPAIALCKDGMSTRDNFRFLRLHWEIGDQEGRRWIRIAKGGEYQPFFADCELLALWQDGEGEMFAYGDALGNGAVTRKGSTYYFRPALTYTERTASRLSVRILPGDAAFTTAGPGIVLQDPADAMALLGLLNSFVFAALHEVCIGGGDSVSSGSAARHYTPGGLGQMPVPTCELLRAQDWPTMVIAQRWLEHAQRADTSPLFVGCSFAGSESVEALSQTQLRRDEDLFLFLWDASRKLEECALAAYCLSQDVLGHVASVVGPHPAFYDSHQQLPPDFAELFALPDDALVDRVAGDLGNPRWAVVKSYVADRRYELLAHRWRAHPRAIVEARRASAALPPGYVEEVARQVLRYAIGKAFGRWPDHVEHDFSALEILTDGVSVRTQRSRRVPVLVDDEGHPLDFVGAVLAASEPDVPLALLADAVRTLSNSGELRAFLRRDYFAQHLRDTSLHRRSAPVLWQLATPTVSYSVWLYVHALTRDALFQVQTEVVAPKLAQEERRLESFTNELRDKATVAQTKDLAAQESFVEELRALLEELKRVAPLWNPNLNDGVIINFAPLWRLVPQHKAWQKELKSTWDALCEGKYDWAHLAMHLWPERVIPKCAKDRSLAIAHRLESVFWVEGTDDKWTTRKTPTRSIAELVRERTSPAVKAALKSLLEAPTVNGNGGRVRGGRRRATAVAAVEGGGD